MSKYTDYLKSKSYFDQDSYTPTDAPEYSDARELGVGEASDVSPEFDTKSAGLKAAGAAAGGGSAMDVASSGLLASGNPYAMGAGLALKTIDTINKRKQKQAENRYIAELKRVQARQEAIDNMARIGQSLRA